MKLFAIVLTACLSLASSALAVSWRRPVAGPLLRPFALSPDRFARGQHRGIDLGAPPGSAVRAACGGRVRFAGTVPGGGRTLTVACGRLLATYQQLGELTVARGQLVAAGAAVGAVGASGDPRERRPHVHLGARDAATGRYVDPLTLLRAGRRPPPPVASVPVRRPVALGPAPRPRLPRAHRVVVRMRGFEPLAEHPAPRGSRSPPAVWIGLVLFGLGLPLGGLVVRRRRTRPGGLGAGEGWVTAHR